MAAMLSHTIPFSPETDASVFAEVPTSAGVFCLFAKTSGTEPYVGRTADLRRRMQRLLGPPEPYSKKLNLRDVCGSIAWNTTGSDFEARIAFLHLLREHFPQDYAKRLRMRPAALVRVNWENAYPRAYVTRRFVNTFAEDGDLRRSVYFGPFASRKAADLALKNVLDLFLSRRCTFELHPDPVFPGCVYSEMKMCLAPCFQGCTDERYFEEVRRVQAFFDTRGVSLRTEVETARDAASTDLNFETAAALHNKSEKVKEAARGFDEIIRRIDRLDAVILQRSVEAGSLALFRFHAGQILGPNVFPVKVAEKETIAEQKQRLLDGIATLSAEPSTDTNITTEHLSLLKRWYYSSRRVGEIFFPNEYGSWPMQKMINAVARIEE